ncbi:DUF2721 domain-containing protein [Novosphingobium mangrovi (ex Huang et al. 2023)]|uniref:DUF2721 domain-containing protein n=1 Tax=Novosphingobium mangrovi (ex Huang et al. 2023) TaxID=2976432 RepID=A0ABT2I4P8_9SPHN|nr:DUF2721 domain-containing protein [Novosphingobium mangrovi (ex Huang et al. 2023)]MCT2399781.1 DUF2721 domain-containing protein [Novosphingobium mangrovi (ex Huang et al. 2023)]
MIAQTIQLALAPVFMLVAIGNILNLLTARLSRVVDRARVLQGQHTTTQGNEHDMVVLEIRTVDQRIRLIGQAMRLLVLSALFIGTTVFLLFCEELLGAEVRLIAAGTFIMALTLLMVGLVLFLRETQVAAASLRIPRDYLELERKI